jgi:hypothetical protein
MSVRVSNRVWEERRGRSGGKQAVTSVTMSSDGGAADDDGGEARDEDEYGNLDDDRDQGEVQDEDVVGVEEGETACWGGGNHARM